MQYCGHGGNEDMALLKNGWYCAATSAEVGDKPFARRILGLPVLLVRDSSGRVQAMSDMCPHRFAPLHKGVRMGDAVECPYHGLRFDLTSGRCVHNPHGDGRIPDTARIPKFPVEERQEVVWIWPGDPQLATPDSIPDLQLFAPGASGRVAGCMTMQVDYRLVLDNLLDLSHAVYLHAGTLAPSRAKREVTNINGETSIRVNSVMRDVATPSSLGLYFPAARGDVHSHIEWMAPGTFRQGLTITEVGADPEAGAITRNAHLITPETERSTHYFWFHSRNRLADNQSIDEGTRAILSKAFLTEDEPMIAACQSYQAGREFFSLTSVFLPTDRAGTRCRRIMERLIAGQTITSTDRPGTAPEFREKQESV
jgi:vanillate O-demethylase monooxygenase subunit